MIKGLRAPEGLRQYGLTSVLALFFFSSAAWGQQVDMNDNFFSPQDIEIEVGETVTWVNQGNMIHTTTSDPDQAEEWDSGDMTNGDTFAHTFTQAGTFSYHCVPHAAIGMVGTVTVTVATHTVSTMVTGPGSIEPESAQVEHGQTTDFTLNPDTGAGIDSVTGCDGSLEGNVYTTGPITGACTVNASFAKQEDLIFQDRFEEIMKFLMPD